MKTLNSTELVKNIIEDKNTHLEEKEPIKEENNNNIEELPKNLCNICGSKIRDNSNFCYMCGNQLKDVPYILTKDGYLIGYVEDEEKIKKNKKTSKILLILLGITLIINVICFILFKFYVQRYLHLSYAFIFLFFPIEISLLVAVIIKYTDKDYKRAEIKVENIEEVRKIVKDSSNKTINAVDIGEYNDIVATRQIKKGLGTSSVIFIIFFLFIFMLFSGYQLGRGCMSGCDEFFQMMKGCE